MVPHVATVVEFPARFCLINAPVDMPKGKGGGAAKGGGGKSSKGGKGGGRYVPW